MNGKMKRICAALAMTFLLTSCPVQGGQNKETSHQDAVEAENLFEKAVGLFQKEEYEAALENFKASYELKPIVGVLFNIAMCERALFRYADAIRTFEAFLSQVDLQENGYYLQAFSVHILVTLDRQLRFLVS